MNSTPYSVEKINSSNELEQIVGLIQGYQRFYLGKCLEPPAILAHFTQLVSPSEKGFLLAAWDQERSPLGFCTIYFLPSSLSCRSYACFNDLYVSDKARGKGVGRALMQLASQQCRGLGFDSIEWITKEDNITAQKLYDTLTTNKSLWYYYALKSD